MLPFPAIYDYNVVAVADSLGSFEQAVLLADAVSQLAPDYREVFILRTLEHVPFDEIAAKMGRSVGAVRMLWVRALARLRQELDLTPDARS